MATSRRLKEGIMASKWDKERLIYLYFSQHNTMQEIGDMYGVSRERIRQVMNKFGILHRRNYSGHGSHVAHGALPYNKLLRTRPGFLGD